jgi:hypothetical protein
MSATGKLVPFNGTATTTETRVEFPAAYKRGIMSQAQVTAQPTPQPRNKFMRNLRITNLDGTNNLLVRLNGGAQLTLKPNAVHEMDTGVVHSMSVQASASTVAWDASGVGSA